MKELPWNPKMDHWPPEDSSMVVLDLSIRIFGPGFETPRKLEVGSSCLAGSALVCLAPILCLLQ